MVAGEQASVAGELSGMLLLQVEAHMSGGVPRCPDRAQSAAGEADEVAGDDLAVGERGDRPGRARGRAARRGATCASGAPAAMSLAVM